VRTFLIPARLAREPAGDGALNGALERRSLPKMRAASASFFLRSRPARRVRLELGAVGRLNPGLFTLVNDLLEVSRNLLVRSVACHGGQLGRDYWSAEDPRGANRRS